MKLTVTLSLTALSFLTICSSAHAQPVPAKPGLWASASQVTINGNLTPTIFDIKGAMSDAEKAAMKQAMAALGLPTDANPGLSCETATQIEIEDVMADLKSKGCLTTITEQTPDHINFTADCNSEGMKANGKGSVTGVNTNTVIFHAELNGVFNGVPINYVGKNTTQFVGPDCANPPAGIDPKWIGQK